MLLERLTWKEFSKLVKDRRVALLPVGTIEAHGPHLPLATDAMIPIEICKRLADDLKAIVLPPIYYGVTASLYGYPGSFTLSKDIFESLLYEVLRCCKANGFEVVVVVNGHGGSDHLRAVHSAARRIWVKEKLKVVVVDWWIYAREVTKSVLGQPSGHAGVDEAAMISAIDRSLVKKELFDEDEKFLVKEGIRAYPSPGTILLYEEGSLDKPIVLNEELCKKYFEAVVSSLLRDLVVVLSKLRRRAFEA